MACISRNKINVLVDKAKSNYFKNILSANSKNPKKFWRIIKNFTDNDLDKNAGSNFIDPATKDTISPSETSNFLNDYFVNIVERLNILDPVNNYNDFEHLYDIDRVLCFADDLPVPAEILLYTENVDLTKSSGVPDINIRQCVDLLGGIPDIVCCIYVTSIRTGIFPTVWSSGQVTLLPKPGDLSDPGNWRPITQTSVFSKLFEKIIYNRLFEHLDRNNIFSNHQYGFRPKLSTQTATFDLTKHVYSALNNKKIFGAACLDVSKAFDSVNHRLLLYKLRAVGLSPLSISWFTSYLNRSQSLIFDNVRSNVLSNMSGIGQGTILGPILFILYINDIVRHIGDARINMYADDCILYCTGNTWDRVRNTLQQALDNVSMWFEYNALKLNVKKSKCLVNSAKAKLKTINRNLSLRVSNQLLEFVDKYNYLGFLLDSEMHLKPLLSHIKKITTTKIKMLYKIRRYLNNDSALAIYKQMILPLFDYCGFLLLSCCKNDREDLQVIQNNALRLCLNLRLNDRISLLEIHRRSNLLSLEQRRCIQLISLLYQHGESKQNVFVIPARNTRAVNIRKFRTEVYHNSKYKNSPYYKAAKFWDTLPRPAKDSETLYELKQHLRTLFPVFDDNFYLV